MEVRVHPGSVHGSVSAPSSKSVLQRYIAAALLSDGVTELRDISHCADTLACLYAVKALGAKTNESNNNLSITLCNGQLKPVSDIIHCGESGLAFRMISSIASLAYEELTITCEGSLLKRPVSFCDEVLPQLHVSCKTNNGLLPVQI